MAAYVIANVVALDPSTYPGRGPEAAETIRRHGGRYLVRNGPAELREGNCRLGRLIVIEFDTLEDARRWYDSSDYAPIKAERMANATSQVVIVQGMDTSHVARP